MAAEIPMIEDKRPSLTVSLLDAEAFQAIGKEWNQLLETSPANTIFLTWEWTFTWWQIYGDAYQLFLLKIQNEEGNCVGLAPLKIARHYRFGLPYRQIEFLGYCQIACPDYLDFIFAPDYGEQGILAVWSYLIAHKNLWDTLYFSDIPTTSPSHAALRLLAEKGGYVNETEKGQICPYLPIATSWEVYLKSLSQNHRYNLQRQEKHLVKSYQLTFDALSARSDIQEALSKLFALHKKVWNTRGEPGAFDEDPRIKNFHCCLVDRLSERGWVVIYNLKIDGESAVLLYAYPYNNRLFYYQMGREIKWDEYSIGQMLIKLILQSLFKKGTSEFDFLRGAEPYKYRWTKSERVNIHLFICNTTVSGNIACFLARIDRWGRQVIGHLRRIIKKVVPLFPLHF